MRRRALIAGAVSLIALGGTLALTNRRPSLRSLVRQGAVRQIEVHLKTLGMGRLPDRLRIETYAIMEPRDVYAHRLRWSVQESEFRGRWQDRDRSDRDASIWIGSGSDADASVVVWGTLAPSPPPSEGSAGTVMVAEPLNGVAGYLSVWLERIAG